MGRVLPILFNGDMVRAILDDRKTVTRRIIKPRYKGDECNFQVVENKATGERRIDTIDADMFTCRVAIDSPYQRGDILYVRETWAHIPFIDCCVDEQGICAERPVTYEDRDSVSEGCFIYRVDYPEQDRKRVCWSPSIHMPKQAARIWLKVTDVRVERLQEIDGQGVFAEGVDNGKSNPANGRRWENMQRMAFSELWNSTIIKADVDCYGWSANPWVWVIEFERCEKPEVET